MEIIRKPKFCETRETDINLQSAFSFSVVYETKITKPHYHSHHNSFHKSKKGHKKSKSKTKSKFKKMEKPTQDRIICKSDKNNLDKYNILTIEEFLVKHRFKLSNKFDRKHCEKFLNAKEDEKPFAQLEEMSKKPILC
jgi:hypothetical protein